MLKYPCMGFSLCCTTGYGLQFLVVSWVLWAFCRTTRWYVNGGYPIRYAHIIDDIEEQAAPISSHHLHLLLACALDKSDWTSHPELLRCIPSVLVLRWFIIVSKLRCGPVQSVRQLDFSRVPNNFRVLFRSELVSSDLNLLFIPSIFMRV
jgi:hypothetical protein